MDLNIRGLRVLVTAGASGIGLATARAFAREGARVHVCDVDTAALGALAKSDPALSQSVCDVSDAAAVARLFDTVASTLGGLDALANNAGIAGPTARCEDVALADWERTLAINLTGQFLCAQRAIPLLKQSANASMANLSSAAGRFGFPNRTPYAASKWGVVGFTKSLSRELGPFGIRVNAICPGSIETEGVKINLTPEKTKIRLAKTPMKRLGAVDDVAKAACFLASSDSSFITGESLLVDGGVTHAFL